MTRWNNIRWLAAWFVALLLPAAAQAEGDPTKVEGGWHNNVGNVAQSASVGSSNNGVTIGISITGQNQGTSGTPASSTGPIVEQPRGPNKFGGPGFSVPGGSIPGTPLIQQSNGGANVIVPGGPISMEIQPGQPPRVIGGGSIGGWSFPTPAAPGRTTPFAPIGPVPRVDAWSLALQAEQEFPVPPIALKVNPDPGRVNVDSWFWVEGYDGSVITHSKTQPASHTECRLLNGAPDCRTVDDSVTVVVHLTPRHYEWSFGDDRNNSAAFDNRDGLGRVYTDPDPRHESPVRHAYHWSSFPLLDQGGYPISLAITWSAEFSANGSGFQGIPEVGHTFAGRHQVRQIQSVVQ